MNASKILIVEDDQDLLTGLSLRLQSKGYTVVTAVDVNSSIHTAETQMPQLIVLDIGLPDGDGFEVMQQLQEKLVHIPVIILTGRDVEGNDEQACLSGAKAFLQKPVDNDELLTEIERVLKLPQPQTA